METLETTQRKDNEFGEQTYWNLPLQGRQRKLVSKYGFTRKSLSELKTNMALSELKSKVAKAEAAKAGKVKSKAAKAKAVKA